MRGPPGNEERRPARGGASDSFRNSNEIEDSNFTLRVQAGWLARRGCVPLHIALAVAPLAFGLGGAQ